MKHEEAKKQQENNKDKKSIDNYEWPKPNSVPCPSQNGTCDGCYNKNNCGS